MLVVVALGGNALLRRGEPMTAANQRNNVRVAAQAIAPVAAQHRIVIAHGNGPQVGLLALQGAAYEKVETYPLDVLDAETEGMIGYMIEQELGNLLPFERPFATLLTMVEVDPGDPAFGNPTKFIGPVYTKPDADRLAKENGELHAEMKRLEDDLRKERHGEKGPDARSPDSRGPVIGKLPTEDDVDRAMSYLKGMYKKLKEKLKEFEELEGKKTEKL